MKKMGKMTMCIFAMLASLVVCTACGDVSSFFSNHGDSLGGGGTATAPNAVETTENENNVESVVLNTSNSITESILDTTLMETYTTISSATSITESGNYLITGNIEGQIAVNVSGVHLFLSNANITHTKKTITAKYDTIITLVGGTQNYVSNTNTLDPSNAISASGNLTINGNGTLTINAIKSGIKCDANLYILGGNLSITAVNNHGINADSIYIENADVKVLSSGKDGIHSESDYDNVTSAPQFSYNKGFVIIKNSNIKLNTTEDGIQADSFVYIDGGEYTITTNGGAPTTVTENSSDMGSGKCIKAGLIDYEIDGVSYDQTIGNYTIMLKDGTFGLNGNDDAIHSNGYIFIYGGEYIISSGDDAIHADSLLKINGGSIDIDKCYEGIESAKIEISDGSIDLVAVDDGINASDGTETAMNQSNDNCYIIISGGTTKVNSSGDGVDSNGSILISGGELYINGPTSGADGALDSNGGIKVTGGTLWAVGSLGMVETPASNSTQYVVSFASQNNLASGTILYLKDSGGNVITSMTLGKIARSIIISSSALNKGETYTIVGNSTTLSTFTISSIITSIGSSTGIGGRR